MNYWQYHDSKIKELKKIYDRVSRQTQNELQSIFNNVNYEFDNLYNIASLKSKNMINTKIEEWQDKGLLDGEFKNKCLDIKNRTRVKNNEILELLIWGAYIEEQGKLEKQELDTFKNIMNYYYIEGQKEVEKKEASKLSDALFYDLLLYPIVKGYAYAEYQKEMARQNAQQIYRQAIILLQQEKELKIDSDAFINLVSKQNNARLNINGDKISGTTDSALITLNNKAKIEGIVKKDSNAQVKFIAVEDKATTKMCHSLDGQIFNVNDWNEFKRYSQTNGRITKYKCYGLIPGLNLPPIDDHFHWCRSTLEYITVEIISKKDYNTLEVPKKIKDISVKLKQVFHEKAEKFIDNNSELLDFGYKKNMDVPMQYQGDEDRIFIDENHEDFKYYVVDESIVHEVAHMKDVRNNITLNNFDTIREYINKSKNYFKNNMSYYGRIVASNEENSSLCDLVNILTDGRVRNGAFAHEESYIKNEVKAFQEISATIIGCELAENKIVNDLIEEVKPLKELKQEVLKLWDVIE